MPGKNLLVVAHVPSPNTQALFDAVIKGTEAAEAGGVVVVGRNPFEANAEDVLAASAIIMGTTENLGYMSGALKDFFDRIYYPCLDHTQGLPYALYVRAGHDGTGTCRGVETIATGLRWRAVQEPLVCRGDYQSVFADQCHELGMAMAAGLDAGVF